MKRAIAIGCGGLVLAVLGAPLVFEDPWWSPDQRGLRAFEAGDYSEAAEEFTDPLWRAVALYRAGDFKRAEQALDGRPGAVAAFDRGNALVFLGRYEEAVECYRRALERRPGWLAAQTNLEVATLRVRGEPEVGEATEVGADDIVFDQRPNQGGDEVDVDADQNLSSESVRALWLRNVQTRPADFLRAKFAYQHAMEGER